MESERKDTRPHSVFVESAAVGCDGYARLLDHGASMKTFAIVPKIGTPIYPDSVRPKYTDPGDLGAGLDIKGYSVKDYGYEKSCLLIAELSPEQRTAVQAQIDTLVLPFDLDVTISAIALPSIQAKLEALNLPGTYITTEYTVRQIVRGFRKLFTFMEVWQGMFPEGLFTDGVTLDTRINQLTAIKRTRLLAVSDALALDRSGVTNTMMLRQALREVGDQLPNEPLGGEIL